MRNIELVKARCTNCGGVLEIDKQKDAAICPFCNTPYIVEKAIHNYQINNQYSIQQANINIMGDDVEKLLRDAEAFYLIHSIEKSRKKYIEATEKFPDDYRGWYGLLRLETNDFKNYYADAERLFDNSLQFASGDIRVKIDQERTIYLSYIEEPNKRRKELLEKIDALTQKKDSLAAILAVGGFFIFFICVVLFSLANEGNHPWLWAAAGVVAISFVSFIVFFGNKIRKVVQAIEINKSELYK